LRLLTPPMHQVALVFDDLILLGFQAQTHCAGNGTAMARCRIEEVRVYSSYV
jgi:hypothetical protein